MKTNNITLLGLLIAILVSGCASVEPGKRYGNANLDAMKRAYVVIAPDMDAKIGANIKEALTQRGVQTGSGPLSQKPKDVEFYVTYIDHWRWDMAMYLLSLEINFMDNATGQKIGHGMYGMNGMHTFPDPKKTTFDVVDSIYKAK
jgi:hypothetical protein